MSAHFRLEWLKGALTNFNVYESVPYITRQDNQWTCHLCGTGVMNGTIIVRTHCMGSRHQKKCNLLKKWRVEWLKGALPNSSAYESVPYITRQGNRWTCHLCGTGVMNGTIVVRTHCMGSRHQKKCNLLKQWREELSWSDPNLLIARVDSVHSLAPRVEMLRLSKWTRHVKEQLLAHVMEGIPIESAQSVLSKYEHWEQLALLELVVWKYCCLSDGRFDSMQAIDDYWALDEAFDPKQYKREARLSSAAGTILSRIKSFL